MVNNVLYVGMMYDITTLLNLEETVDNIYVIDLVDLNYGQFVEGKENSWTTLKEKIKTILLDGFYIDPYQDIKQINKLGKAVLISEEDIITGYNIDTNRLNEKHRWSMKFKYDILQKEINLIFYGGYCSEEEWPIDIININCIMSMGAYFYKKLDDKTECDKMTEKMIIERCTIPLSYYMLYFSCKQLYYEKICDELTNYFLTEIGKTILNDFTYDNLIKLLHIY
jgi:hypothetical protein